VTSLSSKREITRTSVRVRTAMAAPSTITLTWNPAAAALGATRPRDCQDRHHKSKLTRLQSPDQEGRGGPERRPPGAGGSPQVTIQRARKQADIGNYCVRDRVEPAHGSLRRLAASRQIKRLTALRPAPAGTAAGKGGAIPCAHVAPLSPLAELAHKHPPFGVAGKHADSLRAFI
jgi:hypothetical protein